MSDGELLTATRQSLQALHAQRQSYEQEGQAIVQELTSPGENDSPPPGIDTSLVDADGYPRGDIDLVRVRVLRGRLAEIRNDHSKLTADIERHLQQLSTLQDPAKSTQEKKEYAARRAPKPKPKFDAATGKWVVAAWDGTVAGIRNGDARSFANLESDKVAAAAATTAAYQAMTVSNAAAAAPTAPPTAPPTIAPFAPVAPAPSRAPPTSVHLRPFAKIDAVAAHSPAQESGLQQGDLILQFGDLSLETSGNTFAALADVVPAAAAESASIEITVQRSNGVTGALDTATVRLTPRPWSGRGLVGCHIVPYTASYDSQE